MNNVVARSSAHFLKKSRDFARVKREGHRRQSPHFNLVYCSTESSDTRFGIVVGRRFGNSVKRNRAKRIVRDLVRTTREPFIPGKDCVVYPRRLLLETDHLDLKEAWLGILGQERLIANR